MLGAELKNIASIIMKQYAVLSVVALTIGVPISYLFAKVSLNSLFSYSMPMGYSGVTIAVLMVITVLLTVIFTQVTRVSKSDPLEGLKVE